MADINPVAHLPANLVRGEAAAYELPADESSAHDGNNEEEAEGYDHDAIQEETPPVLAPEDPRRNNLTETELEWAMAIKEAVEHEGTSNLEPLKNDFWYAQIALVDKEDVEGALERVSYMNYFRQEYDILDTVEQGRQAVQRFMELWPDFYLSLSCNVATGNFVLIFDMTKFYSSVLRQHEDAQKVWFQAIYYVNHSICADMEAIRRGMCLLLECEGFEWKKNFGLEVMKPYWGEIVAHYPLNHHKIRYFHTGVIVNSLCSMAKRVMGAKDRDKFEVGCVSQHGRLDQLYLQPNARVARERFLNRFTTNLKKRYDNEAKFKL